MDQDGQDVSLGDGSFRYVAHGEVCQRCGAVIPDGGYAWHYEYGSESLLCDNCDEYLRERSEGLMRQHDD